MSRFFRRARWDDERARELEDYLAHEIEDNLARGLSPDDARRAAGRKLGNTTRIREEIYEMNTVPFLDTLAQDLRYGLRLLRRNPTFAIVAILTLALGTGANAAIFQLVNALRLRPLPVERPEEIVSVGIDHHDKGRVGRGYGGRSIFTEPLWQEIRARQQAFSSIFAWAATGWDLAASGEAQRAQGLYVSGQFFDTLGVRAHIGRLLSDTDDRPGCGSPGAVLSYAFWHARYGASAAAIGRTIMLDRRPFEVIGVAPPGFFGVEVGRAFDVALPLCAEPLVRAERPATGRRDAWWLDIMGRLKPDWTLERARAHVAAISPAALGATISPSYNAEVASNYAASTFTAERAGTGVSRLRSAYATPLWLLLGATGLVLLLACANLANLMLARATARGREIAVRLATGASRRRIVRQMLAESAIVAGAGALGGLLLARTISAMLVAFLDRGTNTIIVNLAPDWRVFTFIAGIAVLACVLFGLSPALAMTRHDPATAMQPGGRSMTEGHETLALRRGLVVVQVALSMVLVFGALLFARTLQNLAKVDLGFDPHVIAVSIDLRHAAVAKEAAPKDAAPKEPASKDAAPNDALAQRFAAIVARIRDVPGVRGAAETTNVPLGTTDWNEPIIVRGVVQPGSIRFNAVDAAFFDVMRTPLVAGRAFDSRDRVGAPAVAIVNESFARRFFPNGSPIGQTFQVVAPRGRPVITREIVGLVKDAKYFRVREEPMPIAYLAIAQDATRPTDTKVVIRADLASASLTLGSFTSTAFTSTPFTQTPFTQTLTRAITEVAPGAVVSYDSVASYLDRVLLTERLMAWLSGFFGVLAMLIASIGLYGVMSYLVTRRRVEIGVRMALGAEPRAVVRMMLKESGVLLLAGLAIGVLLAMAVVRYAAALLYGITPWDATTIALAIGVLGGVSLLAAWIPARRASTLSPTIALRE